MAYSVARGLKSLAGTGTAEKYWIPTYYTSPEISNGASCSKESDIFAFGMVVVEVGGDRFSSREIASLGYQGFHRQGTVP